MQLMEAARRFRFAGVMLEEGERFYARPCMAKALVKLGRATASEQEYYETRVLRAPPAVMPEIDDLRAQYQAKFGNPADRRWKEARLRKELDQG